MPEFRRVTRSHVEAALAECDRMGRERFLEHYGFGESHSYRLRMDGRVYDSKAILGVAYRYATGARVSNGEFNGGRSGAAGVLSRLGFEIDVIEPRTARAPSSRPATRTLSMAVPPDLQPASPAPDVVLVGCVKSKQPTPSPAQDLYTSPLWRRRRAYAEQLAAEVGLPWFVLSAEHGLVRPLDVLAPYDCYLPKTSAEYRRSWGRTVVENLIVAVGPLQDRVVEVHAGAAYVSAISDPLEREGARVSWPVEHLTLGQQLAWYASDHLSARTGPNVTDLEATLTDPARAVPAVGFMSSPYAVERPGLYAWFCDPIATEVIQRVLGVDPTSPVYVGQAGATTPGRPTNDATLKGRISGNHLSGNIGGSTFALTWAALLHHDLGLVRDGGRLDPPSRERLRTWMMKHLSLVTVAVGDRLEVGQLEHELLTRLDPTLNIQDVTSNDARRRLTVLRSLV